MTDTFGSFGSGSPLGGGSAKAALRLAPVFSATSLIADTLAIIPMAAYEAGGGAKKKVPVQPELMYSPHVNPIFTRVEWLHQFTTSFLMRGNAYGLITAIDSAGTPTKIYWMNPDNVQVDESHYIPKYSHNGKPLDISTVVHIPWYPGPGSVVGLSPIAQFQQILETGSSATKFGRDWFRNGSTPSGHLKYGQGQLNGPTAAKAKAQFKAAVQANDIFVSGSDWEWKALSVSPNESQFLETIKATANQIAAIFHVDPDEIGGSAGSSMTYQTLEMNQIKFQTRALQPIFTRLEHHLSRLMPNFQYVKFNPDAIVRTDLKTRMESHEIALRTAMETQDEGRALEDKAPLTASEKSEWMQTYGKSPSAPQPQARNGGAADA
ncbi:phage portal protein [Arthrobacter alpinus]|uniref:phage portal protein n=1 Tax=Arthrobacter alpinus TaxID=656366 RepID=UPI0012FE9CF5|nr:phage portal protein [Arthrobacter alpinus]